MSEFNFDRTMDENTVYKFNKYFSTGKKIAPDFTFASDTNQTWLTKDDFLGLVKL